MIKCKIVSIERKESSVKVQVCKNQVNMKRKV